MGWRLQPLWQLRDKDTGFSGLIRPSEGRWGMVAGGKSVPEALGWPEHLPSQDLHRCLSSIVSPSCQKILLLYLSWFVLSFYSIDLFSFIG